MMKREAESEPLLFSRQVLSFCRSVVPPPFRVHLASDWYDSAQDYAIWFEDRRV